MHYVYLLKSISDPTQRYIGYSADLRRRLEMHNKGGSRYTSTHKPWKLVTYLAFSDKSQAQSFESYLKTGAGFAFAEKRLWV